MYILCTKYIKYYIVFYNPAYIHFNLIEFVTGQA